MEVAVRRDIGIFLFVLGVFLLNWPFLKLFDFSLPLYIFSAWFLFVAVMMITDILSSRRG